MDAVIITRSSRTFPVSRQRSVAAASLGAVERVTTRRLPDRAEFASRSLGSRIAAIVIAARLQGIPSVAAGKLARMNCAIPFR
jgi:hypothetical protein